VAQLTYAYSQVFGHWASDQAAVDGVDVELLPLPPRDGRGPLDFAASADLIRAAELQTRQWLAERAVRAEQAVLRATSGVAESEPVPALAPLARPRLDRDLRLLPTPHGRAPLAARPFAVPLHHEAAVSTGQRIAGSQR
jgi:hypothetical protein